MTDAEIDGLAGWFRVRFRVNGDGAVHLWNLASLGVFQKLTVVFPESFRPLKPDSRVSEHFRKSPLFHSCGHTKHH